MVWLCVYTQGNGRMCEIWGSYGSGEHQQKVNLLLHLKCLWAYYSVSPKNVSDVNKEKGQSPSVHHMIGGRPVRNLNLVCIHKNSTII
jgi:hypothetical protein